MLKKLYLKRREEQRLRGGHLWIYSNEIDVLKTPVKSFVPGELVQVHDFRDKCLGIAYVNPKTLIAARLLSAQKSDVIDQVFWKQRLEEALKLRATFFKTPFYRAVFGEADRCPGLVVDRYDETAVIQMTTAGMEAMKEVLVKALKEVLGVKNILLRNDTSSRELEGLPRQIEAAEGTPPESILLEENNVKFQVPIWTGQKTGWFYDQADNRKKFLKYVKGKRVLDIFSYLGAWGIQAAVQGAKEVLCIDSSEKALNWLKENAALNQVSEKIKTLHEDAFQALKDLQKAKEKFDVIVVDPPALIKRRKDQKAGEEAYLRLNKMAMSLLNKEGILVSASCSQHLSSESLRNILQDSVSALSLSAQILEHGHQALDHPIHFAMRETEYLKAFFVRVV